MSKNKKRKFARKFARQKKCMECEIQFRPRLDNVKAGKGKFCSKSCSALHRNKKKMVYFKCKNCGETFHRYRKKMIYCSRKCSHEDAPPNFNPNRLEVETRRKLTAFCHKILRRSLYDKQDKSTFEALGYNSLELKKHIESTWIENMDWSNYGINGWHIDHMKPICAFSLDSDVKEINHLSNLRAMWAKDNYRKGKKWKEK